MPQVNTRPHGRDGTTRTRSVQSLVNAPHRAGLHPGADLSGGGRRPRWSGTFGAGTMSLPPVWPCSPGTEPLGRCFQLPCSTRALLVAWDGAGAASKPDRSLVLWSWLQADQPHLGALEEALSKAPSAQGLDGGHRIPLSNSPSSRFFSSTALLLSVTVG